MNQFDIIIISYNTREMTLDCLRHLYVELRDSEMKDAQIWLVDNNSGDGSVEAIAAEFPDVHLIVNERNVGFGVANNQVLERTQGQFLLLMNSDAFPEAGALQLLVAHLEAQTQCGLAAPCLLNEDGSIQRLVQTPPSVALFAMNFLGVPRSLSRRFEEVFHLQHQPFFKGACLLVRREAYQRVGGFDPDFFFYMEEAEWQARLRDAGYGLDYVPAARVVHLSGGSGGDPFRLQLLLAVASDTYLWKRSARPLWIIYRLALMLWCGRKLLFSSRSSPDRRLARWILARPFSSTIQWQKAARES